MQGELSNMVTPCHVGGMEEPIFLAIFADVKCLSVIYSSSMNLNETRYWSAIIFLAILFLILSLQTTPALSMWLYGMHCSNLCYSPSLWEFPSKTLNIFLFQVFCLEVEWLSGTLHIQWCTCIDAQYSYNLLVSFAVWLTLNFFS